MGMFGHSGPFIHAVGGSAKLVLRRCRPVDAAGSRAVELLCFEVSRSGDAKACCFAGRFTASVSGLRQFPIGLAPVGWVGYWRKVFLNFAKLWSAMMCAIAVLQSPHDQRLRAMQSRTPCHGGFLLFRTSDDGEQLRRFSGADGEASGSAGETRLGDAGFPEALLPASVCFSVWLVCFIVRIRLCILDVSEIFAAQPLHDRFDRAVRTVVLAESRRL